MSRNQLILYTIPFLLRFTNLYNEGHRRRQSQRKVVDRQIDKFLRKGEDVRNAVSLRMCSRFKNDVIVVALVGLGLGTSGQNLVSSPDPPHHAHFGKLEREKWKEGLVNGHCSGRSGRMWGIH